MMGRPPVPTAIKIMKGNPGKRPIRKDEPQLEVQEPEIPAHLDEVAREEWERLVPILKQMRVLTIADRIALGNLCQAYSTLIAAQKNLAQAGLLYKTRSGYIQQSPLLGIINQQVRIISSISGEFGLTPGARVRLHAAPEESGGNKWADVG
jgi:P27 family predicted phage terminase small subunit